MSPIENCWFGTARHGDDVAEEPEQVVVLLGAVLHRLLDRHVHLAAVALSTSSFVGMPWFSAITSTLSATPTAMMSHPLDLAVDRRRTRGSAT